MDQLRALFTGLMIVFGLGCATLALAAQGARWSIRLDVLTHFAPLLLVGALAPLLYGWIFESGGARLWLVLLGGVAALSSAALMAPEWLQRRSPSASADAPDQIKLIQFNVWRHNSHPAATIAWLKAQDADIIVLQEAGQLGGDAARALGYHEACPGCSTSILSKVAPLAVDAPRRGSRSSFVRATYGDRHGRFSVVGVHLYWPIPSGPQQAQERHLAIELRRLPQERLILSGDLNSTPWSFSRRRADAHYGLERRTRAVFSWPIGKLPGTSMNAPFPLLPIDHVYAGPAWRTVRVERGPKLGSDHYPVIVVLAPAS